jgi:hypothetical protein
MAVAIDSCGAENVNAGAFGYLNKLGKAKFGKQEINLDGPNARDGIQTIYDQAYKAGTPSQAEKSAAEISSALQQALPPGGVNILGNIGGPIPRHMKASSFGAAKLQLNRFADEIFKHPHCKGLYSEAEQAAVKELVIGKALEYLKEAGVNPEDAMKLVRDNLIKVHHQQTVDHKAISGSDHGVRHVIQSNVAHTLHALDQLGENVSAKQKLMAMQIMIDHDLGYTTEAARGSFGAAKDHPLASAAYLEMGGQNSDIFSSEEQAYMQEAVLKHSYPFGLDQPFDFHKGGRENAIAGIISVVDAMGVTADTKCPALFREVLDETALQRLAKSDGPEVKRELHAIIDQAVEDGRISRDVAEGYRWALEYDANTFGAKGITAQFGGQLLGTEMEQVGDRQYALRIDFGVSEKIKHLATILGNPDNVGAFEKVAKDLFPPPIFAKGELGRVATAVESDGQNRTFERIPPGAIKLTMTPLGDKAGDSR